ncbi:MAG: DUF1028 domain-containing protein [Acidobacteriota bacterium]|nr:DUF1028 domain-containing protein [Acidobacteriota bacterium]
MTRRTSIAALALGLASLWPTPHLGAQIPVDETGEEIVATFSIVGRDPATGELGVAVQSRAFRAGAVVSYAKAGVGAIATQAAANQTYGPRGLDLLELGLTPDEVVEHLTGSDPGRDRRQLAVIDDEGRVRAYTGSATSAWAGHVEGDNFSVQGNILAGEAVVRAMAEAFESSDGPLAFRLMDALDAGEAAGGDARGKQAGGILVVKPIGDSGRTSDRWVDVRVDDHAEPFKELRRLVNMSISRIHSREARTLAAAGRFDEAVAAQREAIAIVPGEDQLIYGLARLHARAGDAAKAVAALEEAIAIDARWRELAASQADFDNIRGNAEFQRLINPGGSRP